MRLRGITCAFLVVAALSLSGWAQTTTLAAETGNNTSADPAYNQSGFTPGMFGGTPLNPYYTIDFSKTDNSQNPVTPGHISTQPLSLLTAAFPSAKHMIHVTPWWGSGSHPSIGFPNFRNNPYLDAFLTECFTTLGAESVNYDWYGSGSYEDGSVLAVNARATATGFSAYKYSIMLDGGAIAGTGTTATANAESAIAYLQTTYWSDPRYITVASRPLLLLFGVSQISGIDMVAVKAYAVTHGNPVIMDEGTGAFTNAWADGGYSWTGPYDPNNSDPIDPTDPYNQTYRDDFITASNANPAKYLILSSQPGFDGTDTRTTLWSYGKILQRDGGVDWMSTWSGVMARVATLTHPAQMIKFFDVTLDDWQEGTDFEAGIENYAIPTVSATGSTLNWTTTFGKANAGQTVSGTTASILDWKLWQTSDNTNITLVTTLPVGTTTFNLSALHGLAPGTTYKYYIEAEGQPAMRSHMAATPATFSTPLATRVQQGSIFYGLTTGVANYPTIANWAKANFNYAIGGNVTNMNPPNNPTNWAGYANQQQLYPDMFNVALKRVAAMNGWPNYEDVELHADHDYSSGSIPNPWTIMDQFDVGESANCNLSSFAGCGTFNPASQRNGVFVNNGSFSDVTGTIYQGTCGATCTIADGGFLYIGYFEPFSQMNFTMATARSGGTFAWQYWNGSAWTTLNTTCVIGGVGYCHDNTTGLSTSGQVVFQPGSDWATTVINGSQSKWWVRYSVTTPSTAPKVSTLKGDDWQSTSTYAPCIVSGHTTCNARGWDAAGADGHHVNIGNTCGSGGTSPCYNLEWDPAPPANQSAQFRQQSRITGDATFHNTSYENPTFQVTGVYTWPVVLQQGYVDRRAVSGLLNNGVMYDEFGSVPGGGGSTQWQTITPGLPCYPSCTLSNWQTYSETIFAIQKSSMKALYGSNFVVGANIASTDFHVGSQADWILQENIGSTWVIGGALFGAGSNPASCNSTTNNCRCMDTYAPGASCNSSGARYIADFQDVSPHNLTFTYGNGAYNTLWDNGQRSPMLALSTYQIASNVNTLFMYSTQGQFSYSQTDEVYQWVPGHHLAANLNYNCVGGQKTVVLDGTVPPTGGIVYSTSTAIRVGGADVLILASGSGPSYLTNNQYQSPVVGPNAVPCQTGFYPSGTAVEYATTKHQATDPIPLATNVWNWGISIPAAQADLGVPDTSGWHGGAADYAYISGQAGIGNFLNASGNPGNVNGAGAVCPTNGTGAQCPNWWRRDFLSATYGKIKVLVHSISQNSFGQELDDYGPSKNGTRTPLLFDSTFDPACVTLCTYSILQADGSLGPGITSIELRAGESAILIAGGAPAPLSIVTTTIPNPTGGAAYSTNLIAGGGTPPYTWSLLTGTLPPPLTLTTVSNQGVIAGTPAFTDCGNYPITVKVQDSATPTPATASAPYTPNVLSVTTAGTLPGGTVGVPYNTLLAACGGTTPYAWAQVAGSLCSGLNLITSGLITGTPLTPGACPFTVRVQDSGSPVRTATGPETITITPTPTIAPTALKGAWVWTGGGSLK